MADKEKAEPKGLLAKIKSMFGGGGAGVPERTGRMIAGVESIDELRRNLDQEILTNEVHLGQIEREQDKLGDQVDDQKERIKSGKLNDRAKITALRTIKRLQSKSDSYDRRLRIFRENIDLHYAVLNKIDEMEAMELKAVTRDQIDEIAVDYEERIEEHRDIVTAGRVASERDVDYEDINEKNELEELERQILAELAPAEPVVEKPVVEKKVEAAPVKSRPSIDELLANDGSETEQVAERRLEME